MRSVQKVRWNEASHPGAAHVMPGVPDWPGLARAVVQVAVLGVWVSLPLVRLEAGVVFDAQRARVETEGNAIKVAQHKARVAAQAALSKARMGQREAHHQARQIQEFTQHMQEFSARLRNYAQLTQNLLVQGRQLVTLNGSLRILLAQLDESGKILELKRQLGEIIRTGRDVWDTAQEAMDVVLDGYNLIGELEDLTKAPRAAELVDFWEDTALKMSAVRVQQDRNFLRALVPNHSGLTQAAEKYKLQAAKLVELRERLRRLEEEIAAAQKRPSTQKAPPGDIRHAPVPDLEPGIPDVSQAPPTGPSTVLPRERTAMGIDSLLEERERTAGLLRELERAMLDTVDQTRQLVEEADERFRAALEASLVQDGVEADTLFAWNETENSALNLFLLLIGWTADEGAESVDPGALFGEGE